MLGVVSRLGDRLLERLVPKTTASAAEGASAEAAWFVACYCGDAGSPYPGYLFPCRWIGKACDSGGCTACGTYIGGNCCT